MIRTSKRIHEIDFFFWPLKLFLYSVLLHNNFWSTRHFRLKEPVKLNEIPAAVQQSLIQNSDCQTSTEIPPALYGTRRYRTDMEFAAR